MPTHKRFTHVIFDLDGTLVNSLEDIADACNRMLARHGYPTHGLRDYCYFVGNGAARLVERALPPQARTPELLASLLAEYNEDYRQNNAVKTCAYDGIPEVLEQVKRAGIGIAVLTNKPDDTAGPVMEQYYPGVFPLVRGGLPGVPLKPDPAPVRALMEQMGADRESTLFIGDSNVDIQTGKNSGIAACGVLWGFRTREELEQEGADYIAATPAELLAIILGENKLESCV